MIGRRLAVAGLALAALTTLGGFQASSRYAEGQVWEYQTRPGDEGSLLKIQRIERVRGRRDPVYHISVIGFRLSNPDVLPVLHHSPVSRETLDASVTRLSSSTAEFPDPSEGIAVWKRNNGGVYDIPVARIIEAIERQTATG